MSKADLKVGALLLSLLLCLTACGRKGDPSPRRMPQGVPTAPDKNPPQGSAVDG